MCFIRYARSNFYWMGGFMNIILFDLEQDTHNKDFYELPIKEKLGRIANVLIVIQRMLDDPRGVATRDQPIRAILTAPEYFFAQSMSGPGYKRQYSEHEARAVESGLTLLSEKYPKVLIIAGTVAWEKGVLLAADREEIDSFPYAKVYCAKKLAKSAYLAERRARGVIKTDDDYLRYMSKSGDSRLLKAREQLMAAAVFDDIGHAGAGAPSNHRLTKLKELMKTESALRATIMARNTAYFYLNGLRVAKYHKRSDYQELLDFAPGAFMQGVRAPIFEICGIRFGVEICLDHNCSTLAKFISASRADYTIDPRLDMYKKCVDIHLVLSAAVANPADRERAVLARRGGYFIHSSSLFGSRKYEKRSDASETVKLVETRSFIVDEHKINGFMMSI